MKHDWKFEAFVMASLLAAIVAGVGIIYGADDLPSTATTTDSHNISYVIDISGDNAVVIMGDGTVTTVPVQDVQQCAQKPNAYDHTTGILVMQDTDVKVNGVLTRYKKVIMRQSDGRFEPIYAEQ